MKTGPSLAKSFDLCYGGEKNASPGSDGSWHGTFILTIVNLVIPAVMPKMDFPLLNASWMEVSHVKYFLTAKRDKASVRSSGCYMIHAARNS